MSKPVINVTATLGRALNRLADLIEDCELSREDCIELAFESVADELDAIDAALNAALNAASNAAD